MRATFVVSRQLVADFRKVCAKRERTFSQELRMLMADEVRRDLEQEKLKVAA